MTWNYRIILHPGSEPYAYYGLHEVYYDDSGKPDRWTQNAVSFSCEADEGPSGIQKSLAMALKDALCRSVLVEQDGKLVECIGPEDL